MRLFRNRKSYLGNILLLACLMCGCTKLNDTGITQQPGNMVTCSPTVAFHPIEELSETEKYLLDKELISYTPDGDDHAYYYIPRFASTEVGVYYLSEGLNGGSVYFYDIANKKATPLCSRIDCKHRDSGCTAYRGDDEYYTEAVFYDSGRIYMIATTDEGGYLDSWAGDGSDYKRGIKLWDNNTFTYDYDENTQRIAAIHRGYFYYMWSDDYYIRHITRVKLNGSSEPEELATIDSREYADGTMGTRMHVSGEKVYVMLMQVPLSTSVFTIDISTKEKKLIYSNNAYNRDIYVENEKIYVVDYDKLYRVDASTGEKMLLCELPYGGTFIISSDGEFIYADNIYAQLTIKMAYKNGKTDVIDKRAPEDLKRTVYVYDMDGNPVDEIVFNDSDSYVFFGDRRYMFAMLHNPDYGPKLSYLDKRLIGSGLHEWKAVGQ